jgi:hypothetical protein
MARVVSVPVAPSVGVASSTMPLDGGRGVGRVAADRDSVDDEAALVQVRIRGRLQRPCP